MAAGGHWPVWVERPPIPDNRGLLLKMDRNSPPSSDHIISRHRQLESCLRMSRHTWGHYLWQWHTVHLRWLCQVFWSLRLYTPHQQPSPSPKQRWSRASGPDSKESPEEGRRPYIAFLNYRAAPLQQGSSPAELLMGPKLRTRIPTLPSQHVPCLPDATQFHQADTRLKLRQKEDFDRRHRARPLPPLPPGQQVWVKTPQTVEAEVVTNPSPSPRSCQVQTNTGTRTRRNRHHLSRKDQTVPPATKDQTVPPATKGALRTKSTLPRPQEPADNYPAPEPEMSDEYPGQQPADVSPSTPPEGPLRTRSGRLAKPREILDI